MRHTAIPTALLAAALLAACGGSDNDDTPAPPAASPQLKLSITATEDFPGTVTGGPPTTVDGWYAQLRSLLVAVRAGAYTEQQRTALADVFNIAAEHLRAGEAGVAPAPEQQPGISRAERRRREREARKGRR